MNLDKLLKVGLGAAYAKILNSFQESHFFFFPILCTLQNQGTQGGRTKKQDIIHKKLSTTLCSSTGIRSISMNLEFIYIYLSTMNNPLAMNTSAPRL